MTCFTPLSAWRQPDGSIGFKPGYSDSPKIGSLSLPCGQCIGCRIDRSKQWATRCVHEAQMHKLNTFITLTYAPEHLPSPPSLELADFQKFMKRFRKRVGGNIRFYHCGEYGDTNGRPHFHAIIFGYDFMDKKRWKLVNGNQYYVSDFLCSLWPFGHAVIGDVTFQSAAYVARYILKKINGDQAEEHYTRIDPLTGEVYSAKPEYTTMSRRPGIGHTWFEKFQTDAFPNDFIVLQGKKLKVPKYYQNIFKASNPLDFERILAKRRFQLKKRLDDLTPSRLAARHEVLNARIKKLPRIVD